ncbi:hypothetical protein JG678_00485 [Campylobacter sp. 2018MI35]|uniref:YopX family protein n=1 Tax=Campylobacter molothri TaxID=1032242 RepID=UPI0019080725|nr:YopX family protein [Campylobacter sp. 2018MI35]MBK1999924.1 hypothetical protein [Campylobacter sp. 2018MI35]
MKLTDFDFRIVDNTEKQFLQTNVVLAITNSHEHTVVGNLYSTNFLKNNNDLEIELWTGFYDRNRKKIYEGDILEDVDSHFQDIYKVVFKEGAFYLSDIESSYEELMSEFLLTELEIIGNIHKDKELLE